MSTRLTADPNGADYSFEWRGAVRGKFSDQFDMVGREDRKGYGIALVPLFELHEPRKSQNPLPNQFWRARVSIHQSYGWSNTTYRFRVGLLLTHESDHETAHEYSRPGYLSLNDVALRAQLLGRSTNWAWYALVDAELYFLSCTRPDRICENFRGDATVGGQLQAGVTWPLLKLWRFAPFVAVAASGIVPRGRMIAERRLLGRIGMHTHLGDSLLSVFVLGSLGNDVGVVRNRKVNVVGAGVAFAR